MSAPGSVLVAEDDPLVRRALVRTLAGLPVISVSRLDELAAELRRGGHSAWILDVWLGKSSSLEVLEGARAAGDSTPVLVITADEDRRIANRVQLAGGEIAFKPDIGANVRAFVARLGLSRGLAVATPGAAGADVGPRTESVLRRAHELGCRAGEIDVLLALERGVPRAHLAAALSVSENTVKKAVGRLLRRAGARSTADLVRTWLLRR